MVRIEKKLRLSLVMQHLLRNIYGYYRLFKEHGSLKFIRNREPLDIRILVSPLRYDILVREDFIRFYLSNSEMFRSDFDEFCKISIEHPYYKWFRDVYAKYYLKPAVRRHQDSQTDNDGLKKRFFKMIAEFISLYEAINRNGFDVRYPVSVLTTERILPAETGKIIRSKYFMGDGCHRLACLSFLGIETLPAEYYRLIKLRKLSLRDNTAVLARSIPIGMIDYLKFLSLRYTYPAVFDEMSGFMEQVRENNPELVDEVIDVMNIDRVACCETRTGSNESP